VYRDDSRYIVVFCEGTNFIGSDWTLYLRTESSTQGIDFGVNNHATFIRTGSTPEDTWFYLTVTYDAGVVVDPTNLSQFIETANMFLDDNAMRAKLAKNGREFAERNFNICEISGKFEEIIDKI